jgi:putative tricarboxylic transport membrane protein
MPIARGSVLGFLVGIVPGSAHIIASFLSYAVEKRASRTPEAFGGRQLGDLLQPADRGRALGPVLHLARAVGSFNRHAP